MHFKNDKLCKILHKSGNESCVICLSSSPKYSGCKRCNTCVICKKCFNLLIKTGNKKCPTCNLECDKCKTTENHEVCSWSTIKNITYDAVIDIRPESPQPHQEIHEDNLDNNEDPIYVVTPIDNVSNKIDCDECTYIICAKITPMLKIMNYLSTLFLLSFYLV